MLRSFQNSPRPATRGDDEKKLLPEFMGDMTTFLSQFASTKLPTT